LGRGESSFSAGWGRLREKKKNKKASQVKRKQKQKIKPQERKNVWGGGRLPAPLFPGGGAEKLAVFWVGGWGKKRKGGRRGAMGGPRKRDER